MILPSHVPDIDIGAMLREVGADSVAPTPTRGMKTRQQRKEAEAAKPLGPYTQSGIAPAQAQNEYFEPLLSGRESEIEYVGYEEESHIPNDWEQTATRHANAQLASTLHVNAQSTAGPSIDTNTLARALTHYASMSSLGVSRNVPEKKDLAVAKSEKPKWDTQKEPFPTFKCRVIILAESLKIEHLLIGPPLGDVSLNIMTKPAELSCCPCRQLIINILMIKPICVKHGTCCLTAMSLPGQ